MKQSVSSTKRSPPNLWYRFTGLRCLLYRSAGDEEVDQNGTGRRNLPLALGPTCSAGLAIDAAVTLAGGGLELHRQREERRDLLEGRRPWTRFHLTRSRKIAA